MSSYKPAFTITMIFASLMPGLSAAANSESTTQIDLLTAISVAVIAAAITTILFYRIKLPALLAYIVSGVLIAGFSGQYFGHSLNLIEEVSHIGLVFLLFIIGLEMDLKGIKRLGPKVGIAMVLQAPLTFATIYALQWGAQALGVNPVGLGSNPESWLFYAVACSLGSTAVVVKLLGDKFDLGSQAGKITVLTLIIEDIWAISALSYVQSQSHQSSGGIWFMLASGIVLALVLVLTSRFILSRIMSLMARSPDLLTLMALGWCFLCATGFSSLGLSAEMGALLAGVTIRRHPEHIEVQSKVTSLRDFFMALFFVALGISLPKPTVEILLDAAALTGIAILARLFIFTPILLAARQGFIVSITASINLAQISEFLLLLIPIGIAQGMLDIEDQMVLSYALMMSVVIAAFAINNNYGIAIALQRIIRRKEKLEPTSIQAGGSTGHTDKEIIILGYFVNTDAIVRQLEKDGSELLTKILVIDFNIDGHKHIKEHGLQVVYGDISNPHVLRELGVCDAKVVISTIPDAFLHGTRNEKLLEIIRRLNPTCNIITTSLGAESREILLKKGSFACISAPDECAPAFTQAIQDALTDYEHRYPGMTDSTTPG